MIRVVCTCGRAFKAEERHAGRQTNCPECGASLTIGPAPTAGSGGTDEPPAWWHAGGETDPTARATAPTRSSSDPGPDAVNPMASPAAYDHQPPPAASLPARKHRAIIGGTAAVLLLVMGVFLWLRSGTSGVDEAAPCAGRRRAGQAEALGPRLAIGAGA